MLGGFAKLDIGVGMVERKLSVILMMLMIVRKIKLERVV